MNIFNLLLTQLIKYDVHTTRKIKIDTRYFLSHIIIFFFAECDKNNKMVKGITVATIAHTTHCRRCAECEYERLQF